MEKMLNEYLQFSRSNFTEKSEKFNLSELIMSTAKKYENKNILVNQESEIFFSGRKNLIQRCLNNLLDNAVNFSKNIKVTQQKVKRSVLIFVEDDGPGIPENMRDDAFKPFFRLDHSRNPGTGGVGLGLTIARDVIRGHGGEIILEGSPSGGLRARLTLPI